MSEETTGTVDGQTAEPTAATGGETGTPTDYAGFETPDALAQDYQEKMSQLESYQKQVADLERIRGTQANELGQLRQNVAALSGQIQGMQRVVPQEQGPTIDDIAQQLQNGDIDEPQALRMAVQLTTRQTETRLGEKFNKLLDDRISQFKAEASHSKYVEKFMQDNPGYQEAYDSGKLNQWLEPDGSGGEYAWAQYQLQQKTAEVEVLKKQSEAAASAAAQNGMDKGIQIEKGKQAAGSVLSGKSGRFAQQTGVDLSDPNQRRQAGIAKLREMRGGG
jgi:hypothetical protein